MSYVAEFDTAPSGTQYRTEETAEWINAEAGDKLGVGYAIRNTESKNYRLRLYENAGITFAEPKEVALSNLSGTVKYLNQDNVWTVVASPGTITSAKIGTDQSSGVIVSCGFHGGIGPRPWK